MRCGSDAEASSPLPPLLNCDRGGAAAAVRSELRKAASSPLAPLLTGGAAAAELRKVSSPFQPLLNGGAAAVCSELRRVAAASSEATTMSSDASAQMVWHLNGGAAQTPSRGPLSVQTTAVAVSTVLSAASLVLAAAWEWGGVEVDCWRSAAVVALAITGPPLLQFVHFSHVRGVTPYLPFQGGAAFMSTQCLAWTFFTAALLIAFGYGHKQFHGLVPPPHMLKGVSGCAVVSQVLVCTSLLLFKEGEAGPEYDHWTTLCVFSVLLAAVPLGTHVFDDIFHLRLVFNDRQVYVVTAACLAGSAPLVHVVGHKRHAPSLYHLFQPFEGGETFVKLQMVGWTCYTCVLVLGFGPFLGHLLFPGWESAGWDGMWLPCQLNWCAQFCILVSLWHYGARGHTSPLSLSPPPGASAVDSVPHTDAAEGDLAVAELELSGRWQTKLHGLSVSLLLSFFPVAHLACWIILAITLGFRAVPVYALFLVAYILCYWDRLGIAGWEGLLRAAVAAFTTVSDRTLSGSRLRWQGALAAACAALYGAQVCAMRLSEANSAGSLLSTPLGLAVGIIALRLAKWITAPRYTAGHAGRSHGRHLSVMRGSVLDGRFHCVAELGRGSVAAVWLSWDALETDFVAVKISRASASARRALRHEGCLLRYLSAEGSDAPPILDFAVDGATGRHQAMALPLGGACLCSMVSEAARRRSQGQQCSAEEVAVLRRTTRSAVQHLAELHAAGVVHLDIKPDNVLLESLPEQTVAAVAAWPLGSGARRRRPLPDCGSTTNGCRLIDLSHAQLLVARDHPARARGRLQLSHLSEKLSVQSHGCGLNQSRVTLQTAPYRAPESTLGGAVTFKADVWSVGCVAFEMATGRRLFSSTACDDDVESLRKLEQVLGELEPPPPSACDTDRRLRAAVAAAGRLPPRNIVEELEEVLPTENARSLSQFVNACLRWDAGSRMSAAELLLTDWVSVPAS
eukprot:TRINITY_DN4798_c2_g1_i2.p1 TRINITY_DN4798_c2_g1~~TRINITY_DN4798_c2_g1_i2.p1  ORF type:complete len:986 (+),score=238.87 TRINITY_DN4798_c2_g1_i2:67-2958(+)